jgi:hypothetical protein
MAGPLSGQTNEQVAMVTISISRSNPGALFRMLAQHPESRRARRQLAFPLRDNGRRWTASIAAVPPGTMTSLISAPSR